MLANTPIEDVLKKHLEFQGNTDDKRYLQSSIEHYLKTGKPSGSFFTALKAAMQEWASLQTPSNEKYGWVKASERLPDAPDFWLANNKPQNGKIVSAKVDSKPVTGYFGRLDNKLYFWYCYLGIINGLRDNCHDYVQYENFNTIEWLDESTPIPIQTPCVELEKEVERLKGLIGIDWKEEYDQAVNEIGQLQDQLKEAENEIRELNRNL